MIQHYLPRKYSIYLEDENQHIFESDEKSEIELFVHGFKTAQRFSKGRMMKLLIMCNDGSRYIVKE